METIDLIPERLYRCDSDPDGKRKLKQTFGKGEILTNLSNGGLGREIFQFPIENLIGQHVSPGWQQTHFLSFSEDEEIALRYSTSGSEHVEYYDNDEAWDFALMIFGKSQIRNKPIKEIAKGIYLCYYAPLLISNQPFACIILIDVVKHLQYQASLIERNFDTAITNAKRDKEWLILPASPFRDNPNELTSKLDEGCFVETRKLKTY
ncbi:MAG: hypothetical protein JXR03_19930 [Cyclobacteriaceae bacterium]